MLHSHPERMSDPVSPILASISGSRYSFGFSHSDWCAVVISRCGIDLHFSNGQTLSLFSSAYLHLCLLFSEMSGLAFCSRGFSFLIAGF